MIARRVRDRRDTGHAGTRRKNFQRGGKQRTLYMGDCPVDLDGLFVQSGMSELSIRAMGNQELVIVF